MTVCIAAQFKLRPPHVAEAQPAFVLCSDGRLSGGAWGSDDKAIKTFVLGWNFIALMAGDWTTVFDMCGYIEKAMLAASQPKSKAEVFSIVKAAVTSFAATELCPNRVECAALISGFIDLQPILFRAEITNKRPSVKVSQGRYEIGEGAFAARMLLHHRGYDPLNADLAQACYMVYEAKRFSEAVDSVGHLTWLKVHTTLPIPDNDSRAYCCMDIDQEGLRLCEEWRERFFLQSAAEIKGLEFKHFRPTG